MSIDLTVISKALSEKLEKFLSNLIFSQAMAYVENIHIAESERLVFDVTEIIKKKIKTVY